MSKRFAVLTHNNTRVKNISLCADYESAVSFHGEGIVVEVTQETGYAECGSHWDGQVFTPGDYTDLIPAPEEVTPTPAIEN